MRFLKARPSNPCGPLGAFSLVEVLVGAMIVGVLFASVYSGISHTFLVTQRSRENLRATQIMSEKMELIRLYTWTQITNPAIVPAKFTNEFYPVGANAGSGGVKYTGTVSFVSPAFKSFYFSAGYCNYTGAFRKASVTLQWASSGKLQKRTMDTLVSSNGLQKYIY